MRAPVCESVLMGTRFLTLRPRLSSRVVARPSEFRRSLSRPGLASPRSETEPGVAEPCLELRECEARRHPPPPSPWASRS